MHVFSPYIVYSFCIQGDSAFGTTRLLFVGFCHFGCLRHASIAQQLALFATSKSAETKGLQCGALLQHVKCVDISTQGACSTQHLGQHPGQEPLKARDK